MPGLRPNERWDRGFEFRIGQIYVYACHPTRSHELSLSLSLSPISLGGGGSLCYADKTRVSGLREQ